MFALKFFEGMHELLGASETVLSLSIFFNMVEFSCTLLLMSLSIWRISTLSVV